MTYHWCAVCGVDLRQNEMEADWQIPGMPRCTACQSEFERTQRMIYDYNRQARDRQLTEQNRTWSGIREIAQEHELYKTAGEELPLGRFVPIEAPRFNGYMDVRYMEDDLGECSGQKFYGAELYMNGEHLSEFDRKLLSEMHISW